MVLATTGAIGLASSTHTVPPGVTLPICWVAPAPPLVPGTTRLGWPDQGRSITVSVGTRFDVDLRCGAGRSAVRTAVLNDVPTVLTTIVAGTDERGNSWGEFKATNPGWDQLHAVDACVLGGCTAAQWWVRVTVTAR